MALKSAGFDVIEADNGAAALALLDGRKIAMVICDVNMPVMNGIEFVKAAKQQPLYKYVPILMLTTESDSTLKDQGRAAGAKAWMVKPFAPKALVDAVKKFCGP